MPMYRIPEIAPPHATAKGTVLRGSRISSPMIDANSSPTSAKHTTPNANVQNSRDCAAPCDRERDSLTGLADFVTHDRRQLQSNQRKAHNAECQCTEFPRLRRPMRPRKGQSYGARGFRHP